MLDISGLKLPMIGDRLVGGNVYFVDSGAGLANDNNTGKHPVKSPLATLDGALDLATSSNGDFIVLLPGHTETLTATVTIDVIGVTILGIGNGNLRPNFTDMGSGTDDCLDVTVADVKIENIRFTGAAAGTNCTFLNLAAGADRTILKDLYFTVNSKNLDPVTMEYGANDCTFDGCTWYGAAQGVDTGIKVEGACLRLIVKNCHFDWETSVGVDDGCLAFVSGASTGCMIKDNTAIGLSTTDEFIDVTDNKVTGIVIGNRIENTAFAGVFAHSGSFSYIDNYVAEAGKACGEKVRTPATTVS